uniref:D-isomer specific 2-hydroxyacid dehydrogenase NAD-binding domain-containing protein n=2 Tax=Arion vulgaris TaxID=1028688 RepID=A0A0B6ZSL1_9EUPU
MATRNISRIHVINLTEGLGDEIRKLLTKLKLDIEVKEISLLKSTDPTFDMVILRKLTSAALKEINAEEIEFLISHCPNIIEILSMDNNEIKWAQCTSAGVDRMFNSLASLKMKSDFIMTRTTGTERGQMMAEYVIGHILFRERRLDIVLEQQKQASYDRTSLAQYRMLSELSVGILGIGSLGLEVARVCKAMNMTVWAGIRDERFVSGETLFSHVDHLRPMSKLNEMLQECDYLVCILPSTPETTRLLSGDVLEPCKAKKTVLINTGRGTLIDDDSLINAVRQGWLGGAVLDVFNTEPLPKDSQLWTLPGVTITPHVSCLSKNNALMVAKSYVDNLVRYLKGDQLLNEVDFSKGY